jgi:hypothetical protein
VRFPLPQLSRRVDEFANHIARLGNCCRRIEEQFALGRLKVGDVELVYTSSFLSACSRWESLLEHCLYDTVCGTASPRPGNYRLASFRSRRHLQQVLLHPNKDYISFQSLKQTKELAALFTNEGRPFNAISEPNQTYIQQAMWIRNAIAHQSDYALGVFRDKVPGVDALLPNKQVPGPFLRFEFRVSPTQRRYELYFGALQGAANELHDAWL